MNQAILLLGGNIGDRRKVIEEAIEHIAEQCGKVVAQSKLYESEAWGFKASKAFINQAITIETKLLPHELLTELLSIETEMGRERKSLGYSSRIIDIDIVFYNNDVIESKELIVPHPKLQERKFTLLCLLDICAEYVHPTLNQSVKDLLVLCTDPLKVWPYV
jgi:2-amino-4-hydroxy-6-hydroxymethyldihydropteridine diphosphokinase